MTGTLITKKLPSGKEYLYIKLSYKKDGSWRSKTISTGLEAKNNKRKAEALIPEYLQKYAWLEEQTEESVLKDNVSREVLIPEYLGHWLAGKKGELRESTFESYSYRIARLQEFFRKENVRITDVTPAMIDKFLKYLRQAGKRNQKTHECEPLSVRSVRDYRNLLFAMFEQAIIDGLVQTNPVASVKVKGKRNRDYSREYLFLSENEITAMLHFLAEYHPFLVDIAFFGVYFGLRRSEILGLKWSAVNFDRKTLTIRHTVTHVKKLHAEDDTKTTAGQRTLKIFSTAEKCLRSIRKRQAENRSFFGNSYKNGDGYVFVKDDGSSYDPNYISSEFVKAMQKFGRPEITLHKLRHTCASLLIGKGWDIKKVQYWLGQEDSSTTLDIYAHYDKKKLNETEDDLADISKAADDLFPDAETA